MKEIMNRYRASDLVIDSVCYYELSDDLAAYYGDFSPVGHTVDMGVEFSFASGSALSLAWVNPRDVDGLGYAGYLVVVEQPMEVVSSDPDLRRYVVTDWPEWRRYRGESITRIEHLRDPLTGDRDAARFWFERRPSVTVALGGAAPSGAVEYSINGLVVFHNDAAARTYLDHLERRETRVSAEVMLSAIHLSRGA